MKTSMGEKTLNKSQQEAVGYVKTPLIIVAGAGTGKTTVVTSKIKYLIDQKLAKPEEILALTFNEKAAAEMQERVDEMMDIGYLDMSISTFHAFCQRLLEQYGLDIGLPNRFKLLTQTDAWLLIRKNLNKFNLDYYRPLGNPTRYIHELIRHFSKCKDELISPENYLEYAESVKLDQDTAEVDEKTRLAEVSHAYHTYNQLLLQNNALDFGDLIYYANILIDKRPAILKRLQSRFKYILVDEFQDVNWAQYQLVKKLAGQTAQLTVVGDDDQSIYAFRGASVSNILRFKDDFSKAHETVLTENYRSSQDILDKAYELIQNNNPDRLEVKLNINKKLTSAKTKTATVKPAVVRAHQATLDEEVKFVIDEIIKIKNDDKTAGWNDFAILVRANNHADPFINSLEKKKIPFEFFAAAGLFRQPVVLDCLNFFKAVVNYHESTAIFRLLNLPFYSISESDLHKFSHFAQKKSVPYYECLKRAAEIKISDEGVKTCDKVLAIIREGMKKSRGDKPTTVLYAFLDSSGYLKHLADGENKGDAKINHSIYQLKQFFDYIDNYETMTSGASVADFLEHFNEVVESGELGVVKQPNDTPDSVNIMTIHTAKGLEFKYVFLVNLVEDRFPTRKRGESIEIPDTLVKELLPSGDSHIEEERRLFYVAMTRAKDRLYLLSAGDYGGAREKKISRFLIEIGFTANNERPDKMSEIEKIQPGFGSELTGEFVYEIPKVFSFSQIQKYKKCPYQYKLSHILQLPTQGSPSFSFGSSMHNTLEKFYKRVQELNSAEQGTLFSGPTLPAKNDGIKVPSLEDLLAFYQESWIGDWYRDERQREDYFEKGKNILREFYKNHEECWTVPIALEGSFSVKIGGQMIRGRIDRIDRLSNGKLEIIDYKTGQAKDKITGEDKEQLLIYQTAVTVLPQYSAYGTPEKLTYYYLDKNQPVSFFGTAKDLAKLEEDVADAVERIKACDFTATPEKHICDHCDFRDICDFRA